MISFLGLGLLKTAGGFRGGMCLDWEDLARILEFPIEQRGKMALGVGDIVTLTRKTDGHKISYRVVGAEPVKASFSLVL